MTVNLNYEGVISYSNGFSSSGTHGGRREDFGQDEGVPSLLFPVRLDALITEIKLLQDTHKAQASLLTLNLACTISPSLFKNQICFGRPYLDNPLLYLLAAYDYEL